MAFSGLVSRTRTRGRERNGGGASIYPYPQYSLVAQGGQVYDSELTGLRFTRNTTRSTIRIGRQPVNTPLYILFTTKRIYQGGDDGAANGGTLTVYVEKLTGGAAVSPATIDGAASKVLGADDYCFAVIEPSAFGLAEWPAGWVGYVRAQYDVETDGKWYYGLTSPHERPAGNSNLMGISSDTSQLNATGAFTVTAVTGTATAGTSTTITLAAGASAVDDFYNGQVIRTTAGTGSGQYRRITDYDGTTKIATVDAAWGVTPNATTGYSIGQQALSYGGIGPAAIIGGWTSTPDLSIALAGDSIGAGQGDSTYNGTTGGGFLKAGIAAVGGIPFVNLCRAGEQASNWSDGTKNQFLRKMIMGWCTHMITEIGRNDLLSDSAATAETNIKNLFSIFRSRAQGAKYIMACSIIPSTNASNTTPLTNYGVGQARDTLNASLAANTGQSGYHDDWADLNTVMDSGTALWASSSYTTDGVHPNATGYPIGVPVITDRVKYFTNINTLLMPSVLAHFDVSKPWNIDETGGAISQFRDVISRGANYFAATSTAQPTYNATGLDGTLPAITFDGNDVMTALTTITASGGYDVFVVMKVVAATGTNRTILSGNAVGSFQMLINTTNKIQISKRQSSVLSFGTNTITADKHVLEAESQSSNTLIRGVVDGTQDGISTNPPTFTDGIVYLGGRGTAEYLNTDAVAEIIVCDKSLMSATDRANIYAHFASKWGV